MSTLKLDSKPSGLMDWAIGAVERGIVPDRLCRLGIRRLLAQRLSELGDGDCEAMCQREQRFIAAMDSAPIAPLAHKANEQHYELPPAFFAEVLGAQRKYSCAYWAEGTTDLDRAEAQALTISAEHAALSDGQRILELGCGWGAWSLWMAEQYPNAQITAVSNSSPQRHFIEAQIETRRLGNLTVITADMNDFEPDERFDRIVSIEMFEHMRNQRRLLERIARWLAEDGLLFVHLFCHRNTPYAFEVNDASDWMSAYFFSGGMMPSDALLCRLSEHMRVTDHWRWNGRHYQRTANAWLANMDAKRERLAPLFAETYGAEASLWWQRWRLFFMACAELFAYRGGQEWYVSHYRLRART